MGRKSCLADWRLPRLVWLALGPLCLLIMGCGGIEDWWGSLWGAPNAGRATQTMYHMQRIAAGMAVCCAEERGWVQARGTRDVLGCVDTVLDVKDRMRETREVDGQITRAWIDSFGNPYRMSLTEDGFLLISLGRDGSRDESEEGEPRTQATYSLEADIVMRNGRFLRYPEFARYIQDVPFPANCGSRGVGRRDVKRGFHQ